MAEKYYIINPTQHVLQIYDIVRILPGTEDEPTVTECTITSQADLEAIQGTESWGLKVLSEVEYEDIIADIEDEEEEEEKVVVAPAKVRVSNSRKAPVKAVTVEVEDEIETIETPIA
jgi:hypothetical protein